MSEDSLKLMITAQIQQAKEAMKEVGHTVEKMATDFEGSGIVSSDAMDGVCNAIEGVQRDLLKIHDKNVKILADTAKAETDLKVFEEQLKNIPKHKNVKINVEKRTIEYGNSLGDSGGGAEHGGMGMLGASIMTSLPLASPLAAVGTAGAMGLASAFTSATAGIAGFGAVAVPILSNVFSHTEQIKQAQEAYNKATTSKQRKAALLQEKQAWSGLDQQQRQAVKSLQSFESFWHSFTKQFEKPVTQMFSNGLKMIENLLKDMAPMIKASGEAFSTLEKGASTALKSPFWKQFFNFLGTTAKPNIIALGEMIGNLGKGFAGLLEAFNPMSQGMMKGLVKLTQRFADWATSLKNSDGFKKFIEYVQTNGPKIMKILGNVVSIVIQILKVMAPLGAQMLTIIERFTTWLNDMTKAHPKLLKYTMDMIAFAGMLKLAMPLLTGVIKGIQGIGLAIKGVKSIVKFTKNIAAMGKSAFDTSRLILMYGKDMALSAAKGAKSSAQLTSTYIKMLIQSGKEAVINAGKITKDFIESMIKSGVESAKAGAKITKNFISSMVKSGIEGSKAAAKVTKDFIASMIQAGTEAARNGAKMAKAFTARVIASGKQAVIAARKFAIMTGRLIAQSIQWGIAKVRIIAMSVAQKAATAAQWLFNAALDANPIGIVILAVAALAVGIYELIKHFKSVSTWVRHAWKYIEHLGSIIGNVLGGLWSKAYSWGKNMVNGFISGITGMYRSIRKAALGALHTVERIFGFHSPAKEGPGQHIVEWGANMVKGFIDGIDSQVPKLRQTLSTALVNPLSENALQVGMNAGAIGSNLTIGRGYTPQNPIIHATFNIQGSVIREQELTDMVSKGIWNKMKSQGKF